MSELNFFLSKKNREKILNKNYYTIFYQEVNIDEGINIGGST